MVNLVRDRFREEPDYDRKTRWEKYLTRLGAGMGSLKIEKRGGKSLAKQKTTLVLRGQRSNKYVFFGIGKVFTQSKTVREGLRELEDFVLTASLNPKMTLP